MSEKNKKIPIRGRPKKIPVTDTKEKIQVGGNKDIQLIRFMHECRARTTEMKDGDKCDICKLRFRCYTEITTKSHDVKDADEFDDVDEFDDIDDLDYVLGDEDAVTYKSIPAPKKKIEIGRLADDLHRRPSR